MKSKWDIIAQVVRDAGHDVKTRSYERSDGYYTAYIESIDGFDYQVAEQKTARRHLMKFYEEVMGND